MIIIEKILILYYPDKQLQSGPLRYDEETKQWIHKELDWVEFMDVIKGKGPCNAQRLERCRVAHEDGAWVREAAAEYARKQQLKLAEASGKAA